jgi:membrane-bound metal-dependent hydrolase YbcI (DUF457 family)
MPFTPYHFGPALITKSIFGKQFSITSFAVSQIIIDLESLYYLLQHAWPVHRLFHTYLGATIIIFPTIIIAKLILRISNKESTWTTLVFAGSFGAYSHIFLDSIMHSDIRPFYPISESNHLFKLISVPLLYELCVYSGIIGVCIIACKLMVKSFQKIDIKSTQTIL